VGLCACVALYLFTGLGVTAGAHRLFTHRSFEPTPLFREVLALAFLLSAQGPLRRWVRDHLIHHRYSDRRSDPHSPAQDGFFAAHLGWLWKKPPTRDEDLALYTRYTPALDPGRLGRFFGNARRLLALQVGVLVAAYLIGALFDQGLSRGVLLRPSHTGLSLVVWGVLFRIVLVMHVTFLVNSAAHTYGSQPYDGGDGSRNLFWVGLLTLGEGWHNNHHHRSSAANHGFHRFWELDITFLLLMLLGVLGLVHDVKVFRPDTGRIELWWKRPAD
jgi:stearoyl-CoA desaturase (delta-9 desaturase)